ncbi:unnamed protein product, partial [Ectocarpus sp. 13 AM-2016]
THFRLPGCWSEIPQITVAPPRKTSKKRGLISKSDHVTHTHRYQRQRCFRNYWRCRNNGYLRLRESLAHTRTGGCPPAILSTDATAPWSYRSTVEKKCHLPREYAPIKTWFAVCHPLRGIQQELADPIIEGSRQ